MESRLEVTRTWGEGEMGSYCLIVNGTSVWDGGKGLEIVVRVVQHSGGD